MSILLHPVALIQIFGLAGTIIALAGVILSASVYTGTAGERYSPLNHFISELGEQGVSRLAWVFNAALILSGALLVPVAVLLGLQIPGLLSKLAMAAGIGAALSLSLVGVYPMNNLTPHVRAARTFFRLGLAMAVLFTLAIALQSAQAPAVPRGLAWAGVPAILAYSAFLVYGGVQFRTSESGGLEVTFTHRPRVWTLAVLEWLIFLTTVLWFAAVALGL